MSFFKIFVITYQFMTPIFFRICLRRHIYRRGDYAGTYFLKYVIRFRWVSGNYGYLLPVCIGHR